MKKYFVTNADGVVLRQGICPDDTVLAQAQDDGTQIYSQEDITQPDVDDTLYQINPETGGFVPRPDSAEPHTGYDPPGGLYNPEIV